MTPEEARANELAFTLVGDEFAAVVLRFYILRPDIAQWVIMTGPRYTAQLVSGAPISWDYVQKSFDQFYDYPNRQVFPDGEIKMKEALAELIHSV